MNPTRRDLLKASVLTVTATLAGCIGDGPGSDRPGGDNGTDRTDETPTEDGSPTPTDDGALPGGNDTNGSGETRPRGTGGPGITLAGTDANDGPLEYRIEVLREAATDDAPPRIRVSVTNPGDTPLVVGEGRAAVFAYVRDVDEQLILLPIDGEYPARAGCWRLTDSIAVTEEYRTFTLDAGETVATDLDLYALPGEDACLPVGEYGFETTYDAAPADEGLDSEDATGGRWGFRVLLE